jgi:hypothetical protein
MTKSWISEKPRRGRGSKLVYYSKLAANHRHSVGTEGIAGKTPQSRSRNERSGGWHRLDRATALDGVFGTKGLHLAENRRFSGPLSASVY